MTTLVTPRRFLSEFCAVDRGDGAIWLNDADGTAHCVPFSHLTRNAAAGRWDEPTFRPPICTDIPIQTLGLTPDGFPGVPCEKCYATIEAGHYPGMPNWPVWPEIVEDGLAIARAIWGDHEDGGGMQAIRDRLRVLSFIDLVSGGTPIERAIRTGGIRSFVMLGRVAASVGLLDEVLRAVPEPRHSRNVRRGATMLPGGSRKDDL